MSLKEPAVFFPASAVLCFLFLVSFFPVLSIFLLFSCLVLSALVGLWCLPPVSLAPFPFLLYFLSRLLFLSCLVSCYDERTERLDSLLCDKRCVIPREIILLLAHMVEMPFLASIPYSFSIA